MVDFESRWLVVAHHLKAQSSDIGSGRSRGMNQRRSQGSLQPAEQSRMRSAIRLRDALSIAFVFHGPPSF